MEYQKLPVEFKRQWIEALRSGKYSQTVGELFSYNVNTKNVEMHDGTNKEVLYDPNSYCCLGVACHILGIGNEDLNGIGNPYSLFEKFQENLTQEELYKQFANFPVMLMTPSSEVDKLVHLNDEEMWTFNKIADWIEENL